MLKEMQQNLPALTETGKGSELHKNPKNIRDGKRRRAPRKACCDKGYRSAKKGCKSEREVTLKVWTEKGETNTPFQRSSFQHFSISPNLSSTGYKELRQYLLYKRIHANPSIDNFPRIFNDPYGKPLSGPWSISTWFKSVECHAIISNNTTNKQASQAKNLKCIQENVFIW